MCYSCSTSSGHRPSAYPVPQVLGLSGYPVSGIRWGGGYRTRINRQIEIDKRTRESDKARRRKRTLGRRALVPKTLRTSTLYLSRFRRTRFTNTLRLERKRTYKSSTRTSRDCSREHIPYPVHRNFFFMKLHSLPPSVLRPRPPRVKFYPRSTEHRALSSPEIFLGVTHGNPDVSSVASLDANVIEN